jgi:hypothetical protein
LSLTPRSPRRPGVLPTALGTVGLTAVIATLPILGDGEEVSLAEHVLAFVLVVLPVGVLLYGLIALVAGRPVPKLLLWGVAAGTFGVAAAYLGGRPEEVAAGPTALPLALVLLADVFRMAAAVCLGVVLARPLPNRVLSREVHCLPTPLGSEVVCPGTLVRKQFHRRIWRRSEGRDHCAGLTKREPS